MVVARGWSGCGLWVVGWGSTSSVWTWAGIGVVGVVARGWEKRPLSSFTLRFSLFSPLSLTPILSLKLGFSFGLIFCCGHRCISRFMVVVVGGCCGGGGDGFIVGLRRWPRIWVAICQSLGRI